MDRGGGVSTAQKGGAFLDSICSLQPVMIPRPKCAGMEFVTVKGRQGYYMSTRRRNNENGPRRPPLAGLFEHIETKPERERNSNMGNEVHSSENQQRRLSRLNPAAGVSEDDIVHPHLQHTAQQVSPVGSSNSASSSETEKPSEDSSTISSSDTDTDKDFPSSHHNPYQPHLTYQHAFDQQELLEPAPDYDSTDLY